MRHLPCTALAALAFAAAGCAPTVHYQYVSTEVVRNQRGHVVGHKELLVDARNGEELEQVTHYSPLLDQNGDVVGYEEPVRGGALIRSVEGRLIGARYADLRSRSSNRGNEGITITFPLTEPRRD
jgi:hypothetical protein